MVKRRNNKSEADDTDEEEIRLFRDSMRDVTPIATSDKIAHTQKLTPPIPHQIRQSEQSTPEDSLSDHISFEIAPGEDWSFLRPGLSRQTLRRLRRGHWGIQAHLDLHGFTRDEARSELTAFLDACSKNNYRCVRVIHGKGLSSKNREPVLKKRIGNWLIQCDNVLAFCQARPENGGSGALLVLLKATAKQTNNNL